MVQYDLKYANPLRYFIVIPTGFPEGQKTNLETKSGKRNK